MKRFWTYYDLLASTNPYRRALLFMALATLCLFLIPVGGYFGAGLPVQIGQVFGLTLFVAVAVCRFYVTREARRSMRWLMGAAAVTTIALLATANFQLSRTI